MEDNQKLCRDSRSGKAGMHIGTPDSAYAIALICSAICMRACCHMQKDSTAAGGRMSNNTAIAAKFNGCS